MKKICLCMTLFILASCTTYRHSEDHDFITRPLIFSKETLIKDRQLEDKWLKDKLSAPIVFGIQGQRLTREITALSAGASIQADPTQIEEYRARQELDIDNVNRLNELLEQDQQTQITRAQQEKILAVNRANNEKRIEDLRISQAESAFTNLQKKIELLEKAVSDSCPGADGDTACSEATTALISALDAVDNIEQLPETRDLESPDFNGPLQGEGNDASLPAGETNDTNPPDFSDAFKSITGALDATATTLDATKKALSVSGDHFDRADSLSVTPIDQFEDELAVRARIREEISKNLLDENHDRFDNRLYRFQHRVSILPPEQTYDWAKIEVIVRPTSSVLYPAPYHQRISQFSNLISQQKLEIDDEFSSYLNADEFSPQRTNQNNGNSEISNVISDNPTFAVYRLFNYLEKIKNNLPRSYELWLDDMKAEMETKFHRHLEKIILDLNMVPGDSSKSSNRNRLLAQIDKEAALICFQYFDNPGSSTMTKKTPTNSVYFHSDFHNEYVLKEFEKKCKENTRPKGYDRYSKILEQATQNDPLGMFLKSLILIRQANEELIKDYNFLPYLSLYIENYQKNINKQHINSYFFNWKKRPIEHQSKELIDCFENLTWEEYLQWRNNLTTKSEDDDHFCDRSELEDDLGEDIDIVNTFNYGAYLLLADILSIPQSKVYTTTPSESAQRIKDIAESSKVINLNLAAQFLAGSVGGEAFINYLRGKEKLLTNILRKPLVIGLAGKQVPATEDGKPAGVKYGWIFGPIFRITDDRQNSEFVQTATNKIVSTDISIPSFVNAVEMESTLSWLDSGSLRKRSQKVMQLADSKNPQLIPTDGIEISNIFLSNNRNRIHKTSDASIPIPTELGTSGSFIVEADNIWRATQISIGNKIIDVNPNDFFGGQKALNINYRGLDKDDCEIQNDSESDKECYVKLRIWSNHSDVFIIDDKIKIKLETPSSETATQTELSVISLNPSERLPITEKNTKITENITLKLSDFHESIKTGEKIKFGFKLSQSASITKVNPANKSLEFKLDIDNAWSKVGCGDITSFTVGTICPVKYQFQSDDVSFSGIFELEKKSNPA